METMEGTDKFNSTKVRVLLHKIEKFLMYFLFSSKIPIYNSASIKMISYDVLVRSTHTLYEETPVKRSLGLPTQVFTECKYYAYIIIFFLQILPAIIIDVILKLLGKKPM